MKYYIWLSILFTSLFSFSQDKIWNTFEGTRVLNNHSTDMLYRNHLEFIVAHKFGDMAGTFGGISNFYGFDNLADVRIAFEYGVYNKLDIGFGRNKGVNLHTGVLDGYAKYRILQQDKEKSYVNLTFVSSLALPYRKPATDSTSEVFYQNILQRFIFTNQLLVSRKFSDRFSLQFNLGYNHRNLVNYQDKNGLFFGGVSSRFRFTQYMGVLVEYNHIFDRPSEINYQNPLHFGLEFITGGHVFTIIFSNSKAVNENLFIPYTDSNWLDGSFRMGFSITRQFKL